MNKINLPPEDLELILGEVKGLQRLLKERQQDIQDPIYTTEGLMRLLNVSRRLLQTWRDNNLIEFSAVRGKFYYRLAAIEKMLNNHLQQSEER